MNHKQDLKKHFDFSTVFANTKSYIDHYNAKYTKLTDKINANQRATAELIIRLYLKQLNGYNDLDLLSPQKLPGFATYNESLAGCKGCTKRTIINHRKRLLQAGFIMEERHGGSGGIELWINPRILKKESSASFQLFHFTDQKTKKFHPLVHEHHEQDNNNSTVDNRFATGYKSGVPDGHSNGLPRQTGRDEPTRTGHEQDKNTGENAASVSKEQEQTSLEAERIFLLSLVQQFCEYALKVLYPGLIISDPEKREIMNLAWASVFGKFRLQATQQEWLDYQGSLFDRVNMVRRWLDRNPRHWIPRPHLYFNPNNDRNGFKNTWSWYLRQQVLKTEVRNQLLLQRVKAEWKQHDKGSGRFRQKTRLQLFRIQQKRLSRYRDENLMNAYHACLQHSLHLNKLKNDALRTNET